MVTVDFPPGLSLDALPDFPAQSSCVDLIFENTALSDIELQDKLRNCSNETIDNIYNPNDIGVPLEKRLIPALFVLVFIVGTVGNALVVYVIYRVGTMKTVTNIYLGNLAAADLLFLLICVTFTVFEHFTSWPFGTVMCKLVSYMMVVTMAVSAFTLTAIAIDRYLAVVHPISSRNSRTNMRTTTVLVVIWIVCGVSLCPVILTSDVKHTPFIGYYCIENWEAWERKTYTLSIFITMYAVPFLIMGLCYCSIRKNLLARVRPGSTSRAAALKATKLNKKVVKLVLVVALVFGFCWLPTHIVYILADFCQIQDNIAVFRVFKQLSHCLSYANSALNPVIYCYMSTNFRRYFKLAFTCTKHGACARSGDMERIEDHDATPSEKGENSVPMMTTYVGTNQRDSDFAVPRPWPTFHEVKLLIPRQPTYDATHDSTFV